jgi:hypothetical protein
VEHSRYIKAPAWCDSSNEGANCETTEVAGTKACTKADGSKCKIAENLRHDEAGLKVNWYGGSWSANGWKHKWDNTNKKAPCQDIRLVKDKAKCPDMPDCPKQFNMNDHTTTPAPPPPPWAAQFADRLSNSARYMCPFTSGSCEGDLVPGGTLSGKTDQHCIQRCKDNAACKCIQMSSATSCTLHADGTIEPGAGANYPVSLMTENCKPVEMPPAGFVWVDYSAGMDQILAQHGFAHVIPGPNSDSSKEDELCNGAVAGDFKLSDDRTAKLKLWRKTILGAGDEVDVLKGLNGPVVAGIVSKDASDAQVSLTEQVTYAEGGEQCSTDGGKRRCLALWYSPRKVSGDMPCVLCDPNADLRGRHVYHLPEHYLNNLPQAMYGGELIAPIPKGCDADGWNCQHLPGSFTQDTWQWKIHYAPPITLWVFVWAKRNPTDSTGQFLADGSHLHGDLVDLNIMTTAGYKPGWQTVNLASAPLEMSDHSFLKTTASAAAGKKYYLELYRKNLDAGTEITFNVKGKLLAGAVSTKTVPEDIVEDHVEDGVLDGDDDDDTASGAAAGDDHEDEDEDDMFG